MEKVWYLVVVVVVVVVAGEVDICNDCMDSNKSKMFESILFIIIYFDGFYVLFYVNYRLLVVVVMVMVVLVMVMVVMVVVVMVMVVIILVVLFHLVSFLLH